MTSGGWILAVLAVVFLLAGAVLRIRQARDDPEGVRSTQKAPAQDPPPPPSPFQHLVFPTAAGLLSDSHQGLPVFMPTASGNPQSALFGSTRTGNDGRARFHSGIDVAPLRRDRAGRPLDEVCAIAKGRVGYVNRVGGNSSYGVYVVVLHDDPLGPVYSLYAHLASVVPEIRAGTRVSAGQTLGIMGHSASTGIPVARAHLHLEIGLMLSERFAAWARSRKITPDRGNHHGWNLFALDPLEIYARQRETPHFTMQEYLQTVPCAFELVLNPPRRLDYFRRHPGLWKGASGTESGILVLGVSEGGVILWGRPATEPEEETYRRTGRPLVQNVNEDTLGRNGMHLIARVRGAWTLGSAASRWIEILTH